MLIVDCWLTRQPQTSSVSVSGSARCFGGSKLGAKAGLARRSQQSTDSGRKTAHSPTPPLRRRSPETNKTREQQELSDFCVALRELTSAVEADW